MKISELEPNSKVTNLVGKITNLQQIGETQGGLKFRDCILEDLSGQVKLTLWGDEVDKFKDLKNGDKIIIASGWCKQFEDDLQLSSGRHGKINKVPSEKPE